MAGDDIAMNQFQIVSDAPYVYVELADGSQGKIKKSDLKLQMYKTTTIKGGDLNNVVEAGEYIVWSTVANIPTYSFYWASPIHHFHPHPLQVRIQCFYITIKVSGDKDLAFPLL